MGKKKNIITKDLSQIYPKLKLKYKYNNPTQSTLSCSLSAKTQLYQQKSLNHKFTIQKNPQITLKPRSATRSGNHRHKELKEEQQTATSPPPRAARRTLRRKARRPPQARTHLTRDALSPSQSSWTPVPPIRSGMRSLSLSLSLSNAFEITNDWLCFVGEWVYMFNLVCLLFYVYWLLWVSGSVHVH
jgi:hypothetical protein